MDLSSRPGLVGHEVATRRFGVATWLDGRQEVWRRDQGFEVETRAFCRGNRGWSRPSLEVTTWLGWA